MPLFYVAMVKKLCKKDEGKSEKVVYYTQEPIVAKDAETAKLIEVAKAGFDMSEVEVQVRPF